jgi:signal transduction histidine kinase
MGLYIASEIIKEHKGEIKVKSKLNKGSVFSFLLPLIAKGIKTIDDYPLN